MLRQSFTFLLCISLAGLIGCGGSTASRSRTSYVAAHGEIPAPSEIRVEEFLAAYREDLPDPTPYAVGLHVEGAHAAWATESEESLLVVQAAVGGRSSGYRAPVSLMFVVDRSGSMREENKMAYVRDGLHRLLEHLNADDEVGITAFDQRAEVILPLTRVAEGAQTIHQRIDNLYPRGSTNLTEGLATGYHELSRLQFDAEAPRARRIILLTDAMANVGDTSLESIENWAANGDESGIGLSAIGVGLAHNDEVLVRMAQAGHGNHYFLGSPSEIERVFEREVGALVDDVADSVRLSFTPAPGLEVVRIDGSPVRQNGDHWVGELGRLSAGQHQLMLITLRGVDPRANKPEIGHFELTYVDMRDGHRAGLRHSAPVDLVTNAAEGTVVRNGAVAAMAHDLRAISELSHGGRVQEASRRLQRVRAYVGAVSAARPLDTELASDVAMLENFARTLSGPSQLAWR